MWVQHPVASSKKAKSVWLYSEIGSFGRGLSSVLLVLDQSTDKRSPSGHLVFLLKVQNSGASPEIVISQ